MANAPLQNSNSQAQAVAASEGMASTGSLMQELDKMAAGPKVNKTQLMEQLLESGNNHDLGNRILKDMVTKMAHAGIGFENVNPQSKVDGQVNRGKNQESLGSSEYSDSVDLSGGSSGQELPTAVKGVGKRSAKFREQVSQQWQEVEQQLVKQGKSKEQISRMEQQFKTSETKKHLFNLVKESASMYYLDSNTKLRKMIRQRGFADLLDKVGEEMGKEAVTEARAEVKSFVLHELENQLILRTFLQDGDFKDCNQLLNVGEEVGLDSVSWMKDVWPQKKADHGLNMLDVPHEITGFVDLKDNDADARRERAKFEYEEKDENDLVLNRLRACYMQLALRPGSIKSMTTWFKVRKLKNGLVRLGVYTKDLDEKLQSEAKTLAKMRTMEMLDEALHERASLFDPTKDKMVEGKIKNCLKNLDRLGFALGDKEFVSLRDKANQHMFGLVRSELENTKTKKGPFAKKKTQRLQKLIIRLQKESNLSFKEEA